MSLVGDDCYFFLNNGCVRGNMCSFRHQPGAKNNEAVCPEWIKGACFKTTCVLRHMIDANRAKVPCYWEAQPNGCLKVNCPFLHNKASSVGNTQAPPGLLQAVSQPIVQNVASPIAQVQLPGTINNNAPLPNILQKFNKPYTIPQNNLPTVIHNGMMFPQQPKIVPAPSATDVLFHPILGQPRLPAAHIVGNNQRIVVPQVPPIRSSLILRNPPVNHSQMGQTQMNSMFPKSEHFSQQVEIFKKMLANKKLDQHDSNNRYNSDPGDYFEDDEVDHEGEKTKRKERHSKRKNKRNKEKEVHSSKRNKKEKTTKDNWSKGDEEILYGDYKDVPIKESSKKHPKPTIVSSDSEVTVKAYEEILREKALRKVMSKRKNKFYDDFEDIIEKKAKSKVKKSNERKHSSSKAVNDSDEVVSLLESEEFSKEDAVELGLNASPIHDEFSTSPNPVKTVVNKHIHKSSSKRKTSNENLKGTTTESSDVEDSSDTANVRESLNVIHDDGLESNHDEKVIQVIPDETAAIAFNVDDSDDLAKELSNIHETTKTSKYTSKKKPKKLMSSIVVAKQPMNNNNYKNNDNEKRKVRVGKAPIIDNNQKTKIVTVTPIQQNQSIDCDVINKTKSKGIVVIGSPSKQQKTETKPTTQIKVKSFEEIMEEKRKRKGGPNKEVLIVSDGSESPVSQVDLLKEKSLQSKIYLLSNLPATQSQLSIENTVPQVKKVRLKRTGSTENDEDKQTKRKSLQLYQPPKPAEDKSSIPNEIKTVVDTGRRKIIRIQKSTLPPSSMTTTIEKATKEEESTTVTPTNDTDSSNGVKSFEEIMREKKLRRQQIASNPTAVMKSDAIMKREHRFLKNKTVALKSNILKTTKKEANETPDTTSMKEVLTKESNVARVTPLNLLIKSESISEEDLLKDSLPPTPTVNAIVNANIADNATSTEVDRAITELPSKKTFDTSLTSAMENIQEALDEKKRQREEELLSDEEFDKEINDICLDDDNVDEDGSDIDDDDLMMELEEMIGSD